MESTSDILEETNMEASEVFIYGSGSSAQQVKIIDKSKRALDISPDAVASLELALQKPRTSCTAGCAQGRSEAAAAAALAIGTTKRSHAL